MLNAIWAVLLAVIGLWAAITGVYFKKRWQESCTSSHQTFECLKTIYLASVFEFALFVVSSLVMILVGVNHAP